MKKYTEKTFDLGCITGGKAGFAVVMNLKYIRDSRAALRDKLAALGFDPKVLEDKSRKSAFIAATRLAKKGILTKIDDPFGWTTYQVSAATLAKEADEAGLPSLDIKKDAVLRFYKEGRSPKGGTVEGDNQAVLSLVETLMEGEMDSAKTNDVYTAIKKLMAASGLDYTMIREHGSAMFVTMAGEPTLKALRTFVRGLSGYNQMWILPVEDDRENRTDLWGCLKSDLDKGLTSIGRAAGEAIKALEARKPGDKETGRTETVLKRYNEAVERATAWAEYLEMNATDQLEKIKAEKAAFVANISGVKQKAPVVQTQADTQKAMLEAALAELDSDLDADMDAGDAGHSDSDQ